MSVDVILAAVAWLAVLPALVDRLLRRLGLVRPNFRGDVIPVGYGLAVLLWAEPALLWLAWRLPDRRRGMEAYAAVVLGLGALGFADDLWGSEQSRGFRGHLRALLTRGQVTTGLVKALGGIVLGVGVSKVLLAATWPDAVLDGATIALCANALNLLDLRPGRAGAAFLLLSVPLLALQLRGGAVPPLAAVWIPALLVYERDARARAMLGDTGSNLLGGALGLAVLLTFPALVARLAVLAACVALHVVAERASLSRIIEGVPLLRRLDGMTGVR